MKIIDNEYDRGDLERDKLMGKMKPVRMTPKLAGQYLQKVLRSQMRVGRGYSKK